MDAESDDFERRIADLTAKLGLVPSQFDIKEVYLRAVADGPWGRSLLQTRAERMKACIDYWFTGGRPGGEGHWSVKRIAEEVGFSEGLMTKWGKGDFTKADPSNRIRRFCDHERVEVDPRWLYSGCQFDPHQIDNLALWTTLFECFEPADKRDDIDRKAKWVDESHLWVPTWLREHANAMNAMKWIYARITGQESKVQLRFEPLADPISEFWTWVRRAAEEASRESSDPDTWTDWPFDILALQYAWCFPEVYRTWKDLETDEARQEEVVDISIRKEDLFLLLEKLLADPDEAGLVLTDSRWTRNLTPEMRAAADLYQSMARSIYQSMRDQYGADG